MNTILIAKKLVRLRHLKHWTQEDISNKLNISRQAVSKWENGMSIPNIETLLALSKLYDVSINEILEPENLQLIHGFEEIMSVESKLLISALSLFTDQEIVIASMGASPKIVTFLKASFKNIDFSSVRSLIGPVKVCTVEAIHTRMIERINDHLNL